MSLDGLIDVDVQERLATVAQIPDFDRNEVSSHNFPLPLQKIDSTVLVDDLTEEIFVIPSTFEIQYDRVIKGSSGINYAQFAQIGAQNLQTLSLLADIGTGYLFGLFQFAFCFSRDLPLLEGSAVLLDIPEIQCFFVDCEDEFLVLG